MAAKYISKGEKGFMNYSEFLDYIKSSVTKILGKEKNVNITKILKTNDIEYDALTILDADSNISPTIYLNQYYVDYMNGKSLGSIVNEIFGLYEEHQNCLQFDIELFKDFNKIKTRIAYRIVNAEKNRKLLEDVPHIKKLDLAFIFYCIIDSDFLGSATAVIHNSHLDMWDISVEDIAKAAFKNTPKMLKAELRNMNEIIREMFIDDIQHQQIEGKIPLDISIEDETNSIIDTLDNNSNHVEMYVLTNCNKTYGASCMFYKNILKDFAKSKNSNIYILPSSVHEVILVPAVDGMMKNELSLMVQDVNKEEVEESEILSNHVYIYDKDSDEVIM